MDGQSDPVRSIKRLRSNPAKISTSAILGLLVLQFLTGMGLNLFAAFPETPNSTLSMMFGAMMTGPMPVAHLVIGFLLPILSVVVLAILIDSGKSNLAKLAMVGLASVALAGLSGTGFTYSGFQNDIYSYLMSVGFISALVSYFALIASRQDWP